MRRGNSADNLPRFHDVGLGRLRDNGRRALLIANVMGPQHKGESATTRPSGFPGPLPTRVRGSRAYQLVMGQRGFLVLIVRMKSSARSENLEAA